MRRPISPDCYEGFDDWTQELELETKRAYWLKSNTSLNGFNAADVPMYYFGIYNNYVAVMFRGLASDVDIIKSIGGHEFKYGNGNIILMFKDGEFNDLEDVFNDGKITQGDIDRIYKKYISTKS